MNHIEVVSSNIKSIAYDGPTQLMEVRFNSGALYRFEQIPTLLFKEFSEAKSKGQYFAKHIRPSYPGIRVKEESDGNKD